MHGDIVRALAGDGKIEGLSKPSDLHKGGNATAIGYVGLWIGYRAASDVVLELPECAQIFTGRDWHSAGCKDTSVARNVVGNGRFFKPGEVVRLQRATGTNGFFHRPFHVCIRHQRKAVSKMVSHRLHTCDIGCEIRSAHLHLDGAKALGEVPVSLLQQSLDREIEVDPAGIAGHAGIEASE